MFNQEQETSSSAIPDLPVGWLTGALLLDQGHVTDEYVDHELSVVPYNLSSNLGQNVDEKEEQPNSNDNYEKNYYGQETNIANDIQEYDATIDIESYGHCQNWAEQQLDQQESTIHGNGILHTDADVWMSDCASNFVDPDSNHERDQLANEYGDDVEQGRGECEQTIPFESADNVFNDSENLESGNIYHEESLFDLAFQFGDF